MGFPTTSYCCCGCSLRTGVLILGYLGLIGTTLHLIQYVTLHVTTSTDTDDEPDEENTQYDTKIRPVSPVSVVINGILSAMLLYGVYKESRAAIMAVVYIELTLTVLCTTAIVAVAILSNTAWVLPIYFAVLAVYYYFTWVKFSYGEELRRQKISSTSHA